MRPPRIPVARVCPCFAHQSCGSAAVRARDGVVLRGWYYRPEVANGKALLMLHGVGSNRQDMLALGNFFVRQGCFVLEPDLRGHGESGGFTTYGVLEEGDMHAWLDWLEKSAHTEQIYGFGASLGGSVLLDSLRTESRFRAVVAESAYSDFPSIAEERIRRALPGGYRWIAGPLTASGIGWVRWHDGVDLRQASPADGLRSSSTPVLLIHGLADDRTSPDNSRRLAREARAASPDHGAETRLWLVPGSGHADAWKTSPAEFEARVNGWFSAH